jgi:hypothetical protein
VKVATEVVKMPPLLPSAPDVSTVTMDHMEIEQDGWVMVMMTMHHIEIVA